MNHIFITIDKTKANVVIMAKKITHLAKINPKIKEMIQKNLKKWSGSIPELQEILERKNLYLLYRIFTELEKRM